MNVDLGGAGGTGYGAGGGRVTQGAGQAGGASTGESPGPSEGAAPPASARHSRRCCARPGSEERLPLHPPPLPFTWEGGGAWSSQSRNSLLFAYRSRVVYFYYFFSSLFLFANRIGCSQRKRRFPNPLPSSRLLPAPAPPSL